MEPLLRHVTNISAAANRPLLSWFCNSQDVPAAPIGPMAVD
jgi:hypothetical protein